MTQETDLSKWVTNVLVRTETLSSMVRSAINKKPSFPVMVLIGCEELTYISDMCALVARHTLPSERSYITDMLNQMITAKDGVCASNARYVMLLANIQNLLTRIFNRCEPRLRREVKAYSPQVPQADKDQSEP